MSKAKPATSPDSWLVRNRWLIWAGIIVAIILLGIFSERLGCSPPSNISTFPGTGQSNSTAVATGAPAESLQMLKGKWLRPDGGYVIEIKSVDSSGKLDAGYFNPTPIHVAKAEAKQEGSVMKVFIELQDVNYPGSTYTLDYVPDRDLLTGIYFQALQQQSFEVYFERLK